MKKKEPLSRSQIMARIKGKGTKLEKAGTKMLLDAGLSGFVEQHLIKVDGVRVVRADLAWPNEKVAVFFDSCFWHYCPLHFRKPKTNLGYWEPKIAYGMRRKEFVSKWLAAGGWAEVRIWEHDLHLTVEKAGEALRGRKP